MFTCKACGVDRPADGFYSYDGRRVLRCKSCCYAKQRVRLDARRKPRRTLADRFWSKVAIEEPDACWPFTGARDPKGYGRFSVSNESIPTHRVAWELDNGPIPAGLHVLHSCDNPPCCNPRHLRTGTNAENHAEKIAKGRHFTKLTPDNARAARVLFILGMNRARIGKTLGIDRSSVCRALVAA